MRNLGYTRKVDELGRVVLPNEVREMLDLREKDPVDFYFDDGSHVWVLKKNTPTCICCHSQTGLKQLPNGQYICSHCLHEVNHIESK